ncbi:hypothetical protein [Chitinophaga japonensis]|uniref:Uncharacterized protein n=1 Tax=Chitinophaga japonensis TaxID=104662 RepID=A0A562T288_CHIJA|nr:hypothetical protein [Chitinophaga japonensis]TWI87787.1 hypothetical protein LX66_1858 [Chitinophaga japonensis]
MNHENLLFSQESGNEHAINVSLTELFPPQPLPGTIQQDIHYRMSNMGGYFRAKICEEGEISLARYFRMVYPGVPKVPVQLSEGGQDMHFVIGCKQILIMFSDYLNRQYGAYLPADFRNHLR